MAALPTRLPVKTALLLPATATRSPLATWPVTLTKLQLSAATLPTKFPAPSRSIAYTVSVPPETTLCDGTTTPVPSALVSARTTVPAPLGTTVNSPESTAVNPAEVARTVAVPVRFPVKTALLLPATATRSPSTTPPLLVAND